MDRYHIRRGLVNPSNNYPYETIYKKGALRFWMYCALSLYHVNSRCYMPLMHFTMQLEYRGLSRIGRALLAATGMSCSVRNYDQCKASMLQKFTKMVSDMISKNQGIVTWDNYNHLYGNPHLKGSRDSSYIKANFTVVAVSSYNFVKRPSFKWTKLAPRVAVASLPQNLTTLSVFKESVHLLFHCFCYVLFTLHLKITLIA